MEYANKILLVLGSLLQLGCASFASNPAACRGW